MRDSFTPNPVDFLTLVTARILCCLLLEYVYMSISEMARYKNDKQLHRFHLRRFCHQPPESEQSVYRLNLNLHTAVFELSMGKVLA